MHRGKIRHNVDREVRANFRVAGFGSRHFELEPGTLNSELETVVCPRPERLASRSVLCEIEEFNHGLGEFKIRGSGFLPSHF
jgi:hypothetical protein